MEWRHRKMCAVSNKIVKFTFVHYKNVFIHKNFFKKCTTVAPHSLVRKNV